jgi:hypothetical protein
MAAPPPRRSPVACALLAMATASVANAATGPEAGLEYLAGVQPAVRPFFVDRRLPLEVRLALDEARRKLSEIRCEKILKDYADAAGMRLDQNLQATGESMSSYLGLVLFYDGHATSPCARSEVLAWTEPGSRAVHVCGFQFSALQRLHPGYAAATLIHETLHTLGLSENPPDPREITARVIERCGP